MVFLDDDDEHLPHRFESQLNAVKKSGVQFILSGFQVRDLATGKIIGTDYARSNGMGAGHGVRWMIARELLLKAGLFDEEMPSMQEVELSYRIAEFSNYAFHDSIVMTGGVNHSSITRSKEKMIRGRQRLLEKHADRMPQLEAAWWNYVLGLDYLGAARYGEAHECFRNAAELDQRKTYKLAYLIFRAMNPLSRVTVSPAIKVLSLMLNFRLPEIVKHEVIS